MSATTMDLRSLDLFASCTDDDLARVERAVVRRRVVPAGEVVCRENDPADRWWIVTGGQADVTVGGVYTGSIGAGETIGELALLDGQPRAATVTAAVDMDLLELGGDGFVPLLESSPGLSVALLREFAARLRTANRRPIRPARPRPAPVPPAPGEARDLDPRSPGYYADPHAPAAVLREATAVHWSDALDSYLVTRYESVFAMSRDHSMLGSIATTDPAMALIAAQTGGPYRPGRTARMMLHRVHDDHTHIRRIASRTFTPRAVQKWRERIQQIVDELLEQAARQGEIDVITDYALPLPVRVISDILGMPASDEPQLRSWTQAIASSLDPVASEDERATAGDATRAMYDYLSGIIAAKRTEPSDDVLGVYIAAGLEDEDLLAQALLLYIAGHETTTNLIANGVAHLLAAPDQLDLLRTDPSLDANAVEEVLRLEGPTQFTRRVTSQDHAIGGVTIPEGSLVTLCLGSANRDPRRWGDEADMLDITRQGAHEHVTFGGGAHHCLGSSLARLEGQLALPQLMRRFPRMAPLSERPVWAPRMFLRGLTELRVRL